eukprot:gene6578-4712_t
MVTVKTVLFVDPSKIDDAPVQIYAITIAGIFFTTMPGSVSPHAPLKELAKLDYSKNYRKVPYVPPYMGPTNESSHKDHGNGSKDVDRMRLAVHIDDALQDGRINQQAVDFFTKVLEDHHPVDAFAALQLLKGQKEKERESLVPYKPPSGRRPPPAGAGRPPPPAVPPPPGLRKQFKKPPPPAAPPPGRRPPGDRRRDATRVEHRSVTGCIDYSHGKCRRGNQCRFSHSPSAALPEPKARERDGRSDDDDDEVEDVGGRHDRSADDQRDDADHWMPPPDDDVRTRPRRLRMMTLFAAPLLCLLSILALVIITGATVTTFDQPAAFVGASDTGCPTMFKCGIYQPPTTDAFERNKLMHALNGNTSSDALTPAATEHAIVACMTNSGWEFKPARKAYGDLINKASRDQVQDIATVRSLDERTRQVNAALARHNITLDGMAISAARRKQPSARPTT